MKVEERTKRRAEEMASKSGSSSEEEEYKDLISISSKEKGYARMETSSHSDLVDEPELPPFEIH